MSLHSVGWFIMTGASACAMIGAALEDFYIASVCYGLCTAIAAYFTFETAQDDEETD